MNELIQQKLQQHPLYEQMTAYERALLCCQILGQEGLAIPGWMQIRQWIGKGSANDIHRAKQEYLQRQGNAGSLGHEPRGMLPTALSGPLNDWWQQLQHEAQQQLLQAREQWQAEQAQWQLQATEHAAAQARWLSERQHMQHTIEILSQQVQALEQQTAASKAALEEVDQRQQRWTEEATQQREAMLEQQQHVLSAATTQWQQQQQALWQALEGAQQFALQQIEHSRQDARHWQYQFLGLQPVLQQLQQTLNKQEQRHEALQDQLQQQLQHYAQQLGRLERRPSMRRGQQRSSSSSPSTFYHSARRAR